ncbi:beta-D-glucosyl crocetin beta-1,6-glucosyltransferase-like [Nicotiana tabacum]|uniref:Beta-D-glucosyl crocetin beta-1,6-glucosyltransferase-like n=2 Tax=Nicotiana TaxID=4085 RepID=A0A1S3ZJZ6_TOBAC|nr:PREDICTED: beta-D-glucosyl crocetin beta-1,6-glucosyltransferase-like [Nicotiana tabacum]WIW42686.1 UDP-glycosyltransferase [Nicotiana tabacum]
MNGFMDNQKQLRVLMFPWLGYGHITPFLELAKKLSQRNFTIYLCSTPVNLNSIKKKLSHEFSSSIQFLELHLQTLPNLPPCHHTTNGLPPHLMNTLKEAFDLACPEFTLILKTLKPDLLIYDFLQPWAPNVAAELKIPAVEFISSSSTMTAYMLHDFNKPGIKFPFSSIYYRDYEMARIKKDESSMPVEKLEEDKKRVRDCFYLSSDIVLIKSFKEIEGKYSDYITKLTGKKVVPIGPLVQEPTLDDGESELITWLNEKEEKSTIFVSFGSEYFLSKEDLLEIAYGLENSKVNFIWPIRFQKGEDIELEEALPNGFFNRVGNRGKVFKGWAPQAKILEHSSIGGFMSHCGWSSVMESMKYGVSIIAMPMHIDQPINSRLVEEVGIAVEVVRDSNGKLHREEVAAIINQVVVEKEGKFVRQKARDMKEMLRSKGDEEIEEVAKELKKLCAKKTHNSIS